MRRVAFSDTNWSQWLARLVDSRAVFFPALVEGKVHWWRLQPAALKTAGVEPTPAFREVRAAEPVKSFFFAPAEKVATFPEKFEPGAAERRVLLGVKGCDLTALRVHDRMFLSGEFADPFYRQRRENTVVIAADCPAPIDSCFCNLVGGKPFAEEGADLTLALIDGMFLLEVLSDAGEELLQVGSDLFQPATEGLVQKRNEEREGAVRRLAEVNPKALRDDLPKALAARETGHLGLNILTGYSEAVGWNKLTTEPGLLKQRFLELIEREMRVATPEQPGLIMAKINSLQDREIISALYRASQTNVRIKLNVRGICCLVPGVPGVSDNIEVRSIVDRFLEHARVFYFANGGHEEMYLSSADWMQRNLDRRFETIFPVQSAEQRARLLHILDVFFTDNVKAWTLQSDGEYQRVRTDGPPIRAQEVFYREAVAAVRDVPARGPKYQVLKAPQD
uniref:Polyphosphate kinase C-terminal domain-containing protein n=1 Tax=candidate division WOR-3 bacterium TaxID=2052148 RepID=A0A7C4GGM6_UNCW3